LGIKADVPAPDAVGENRPQIVAHIIAYADSELLCHRADEPELAQEQQKAWQPLLDWCAGRFQAPLNTGAGIMPIKQPPESLQALRRAVEAYDDKRLIFLVRAVDASGSLVLGLALAERHITAAQAFDTAELDATHQIRKWGEDPATLVRRAGIRRELEMCEREFKVDPG